MPCCARAALLDGKKGVDWHSIFRLWLPLDSHHADPSRHCKTAARALASLGPCEQSTYSVFLALPISNPAVMDETIAPYPAFSQESPSNHAARILVISYIFLSIAILIMTIRLAWRWKLQKKVSIDDWFIIAATVSVRAM